MLHRAFGGSVVLTGGGFLTLIAVAFQGAQSDAGKYGLLIGAGVCLLLFIASAVGWVLTSEKPVTAGVQQTAAQASATAGGDMKADHGSSIASPTITNSFNKIIPVPDLVPPSVRWQVHERCLWLTVTNHDTAEPFVVEVSQFALNSGETLRPRWHETEQEERVLKRGESALVRVLCVEPDVLRLPALATVVDRITYNYQRVPYEQRKEAGQRLLRFYGVTDRDLVANVNAESRFTVKVMSNRHAAFVTTISYGVTEHDRLVAPFSLAAIEQDNATYQAEQAAALAKLSALMDKYTDTV